MQKVSPNKNNSNYKNDFSINQFGYIFFDYVYVYLTFVLSKYLCRPVYIFQ